jgi:zinc and cadmium transporter
VVFFFLLTKAELWHHGHEHAHEHEHHVHDHTHAHPGHTGHHHAKSSGWSLLTGDSVHCFGDGILIASAFIADLQLGVLAALAVLVHEVPHHMGDLVVLRSSTGTRQAAIIKVSLAGAVTALGGAVGYVLVDALHDFLPYFLVVASSSFIYVALADLIPQLQRRLTTRETGAQVFWLIVGMAMVTGVGLLAQTGHVH